MLNKKKRRLSIESLESRSLMSATPYRPLAGPETNMQAAGLYHNPTGSPDHWVQVGVQLKNPSRDRGGFEVQLFWEDNAGTLTDAGRKCFIKTATPAWGPDTYVNARFLRAEVKPAPSAVRSLVAIVDPSNATPETSELDNAIKLNIATRRTQPLVEQSATPRTFVFLIGGFLSNYSTPSGMDILASGIKQDGRLGQLVFAKNGEGTGPTITNDARSFMNTKLRENAYTPNDRVLLVGHSLGADAARQIASDVSTAYAGAQPADALVTIDPISFRYFQQTGKLIQSSLPESAPGGLARTTVLNVYQRTGLVQGYTISGVANEYQRPQGADGVAGTNDDITHTSIDNVKPVHDRIIKFLVAGGREGRNARSTQARFDGDAKTDMTVWRPQYATWHIVQSATNLPREEQFGLSRDIPVNGDFDGDGKSDKAVWRPAEGNWYVQESTTGRVVVRQWGLPGDDPLPGDYDGDGRTDLAVWRRSDQTWYVQFAVGRQWTQRWGEAGDVPVPQDFDGDGKTDLAIWRKSTGTWWVWNSTGGSTVQQWGLSQDIPVPGDYDGDGRSDFAVWRPSEGNWYIIQSGSKQPIVKQWGLPGDVPQAADFDGDGRMDFATWRPDDAKWYIVPSNGSNVVIRQWGRRGDIPTANAMLAYLTTRR